MEMIITIFNSQRLNWSFFQVVVVHPSWSYEYVYSFHLTQIIDHLRSTWPNHVSLTVYRVIIAGLLKMNLNQFLVLELKLVLQSKLFLKVCEVLLCTALPVKYCSVFLIAYPPIRPRSSYAMLACLGWCAVQTKYSLCPSLFVIYSILEYFKILSCF